jgi:hypothetical protein
VFSLPQSAPSSQAQGARFVAANGATRASCGGFLTTQFADREDAAAGSTRRQAAAQEACRCRSVIVSICTFVPAKQVDCVPEELVNGVAVRYIGVYTSV